MDRSQKGADSVVSLRGRFARPASVLAILLLTLTFLTLPSAPPDNDVDSSLGGVLSYAHQHELQFGSDLVLTYGPLGYLMFFYFSPHLAGWRMAVDVGLGVWVATGLWLVAWRLRLICRWSLLLLFFWIAPNTPTRADFIIYTGLCCWGILCFVESGRRLPLYALAFALLAAFAVLAKVSFLFVGTVSVALVVGDLSIRGRFRMAWGLAGGFAAAFLVGWIGSGQRLSHLGAYFVNGLAVVEAYNGALGWEGPELVRHAGLLLAPVIVGIILLRGGFAFEEDGKRRGVRRGLLIAWAFVLAFSAWKYGCVRAGREVVMFGFLSLLVLILEAVPCARRQARWLALTAGLVACAISAIIMQEFFFLRWPDSLTEPFRALGRNVVWLSNPAEYRRGMEKVIATNRRMAQLPGCRETIGNATVDVFGQCQAYALHNDLNYDPRPVFQSYVACSRRLMELNEKFHQSKNAPEYALFRLSVLDRKFPPMEDGLVLGNLLANYQPVMSEGRFVLLKANGNKPFKTSFIREGSVRLGEPIDLRGYGDADLWVEISLEPTFLGRARQFLYRQPTVRIAVWTEPGGKLMVRNHAPAQMLAAGFLASPLLQDTQDVLNLYTGRAVKRPGTYSVEVLSGEKWCWKDLVRYRVYRVESQLGRCVAADATAALYEPFLQKAAVDGPVIAAQPRDFVLFRPTRWRPTMPQPGGWEENLVFAGFVAAPLFCAGLLMWFFRRIKTGAAQPGWKRLLVGNALVFLLLFSTALLASESYYRFFYDTTDALAFTKTTERWVLRHWRQNHAGCRDNVEYSPTLEPGKRRITFAGDSFTAGHGIKDVEDRFPNLLRQAHPEWDIQTLAAVGLDTGGEITLMKKAFAKGYQADQVVLVYCLNDIGDLLPVETDINGKVLSRLDNSGWLVRNSYAINLWYFHYQASRIPLLKNYGSFLGEAYNGKYWEQQKERLREFRDLVQAHGGRLAVVTFPFLHALGPNYEYQSIHNKLQQCWQELGVPELDLLSAYESRPSTQLVVNRYDAHPNEYANQLAADAIAKWLEQIDPTTNFSKSNAVIAP